MVEQFGFAIIVFFLLSRLPFISGTINGISLFILHADELSITIVLTSANFGAQVNEVTPPAENIAISGFFSMAFSIEITLYSFFEKVIFLPTDFDEATGINSVIEIFFSSSTFKISLPTKPVAPITATFIYFYILIKFNPN